MIQCLHLSTFNLSRVQPFNKGDKGWETRFYHLHEYKSNRLFKKTKQKTFLDVSIVWVQNYSLLKGICNVNNQSSMCQHRNA